VKRRYMSRDSTPVFSLGKGLGLHYTRIPIASL
jgi:hypothetical protein